MLVLFVYSYLRLLFSTKFLNTNHVERKQKYTDRLMTDFGSKRLPRSRTDWCVQTAWCFVAVAGAGV